MRWMRTAAPLVIVLTVLIVVLVVALRSRFPAEPGPAGNPADTGSISATTPSSTGAWYDIAFSSPAFPDDRSKHHGGLEDRLITLMDRSQQTMDVAVYEFDLQSVADAMARAAKRGVQVRMVTDSDTLDDKTHPFTQQAMRTVQAANIPVVGDNRKPIMHNKFTVVDGEWVETGSWNYTDSDTYRNNNHSIIVQSRDLASNYTAEFEKMFATRTFGPAKAKGVPLPSLSIAGTRVENYFSPEDRPASHVIRWVRTAQEQIHFLAFSFTHDGIGDAMIERSQAGVKVAGVFETEDSTTRFSEFPKLKQAGLDVLQDGNPWRMHHKVILIDGHVSIFGSFNFSSNADRQNDENLLIADDPGLAAALETEYQRVRATALNPPAARR